ncbi:hypothetical protein CDIK_2282 [Cucumispora dikerogammari]|nr:hypothetical protein CDIK_2282 [Cucumispora dikerogammari]
MSHNPYTSYFLSELIHSHPKPVNRLIIQKHLEYTKKEFTILAIKLQKKLKKLNLKLVGLNRNCVVGYEDSEKYILVKRRSASNSTSININGKAETEFSLSHVEGDNIDLSQSIVLSQEGLREGPIGESLQSQPEISDDIIITTEPFIINNKNMTTSKNKQINTCNNDGPLPHQMLNYKKLITTLTILTLEEPLPLNRLTYLLKDVCDTLFINKLKEIGYIYISKSIDDDLYNQENNEDILVVVGWRFKAEFPLFDPIKIYKETVARKK